MKEATPLRNLSGQFALRYSVSITKLITGFCDSITSNFRHCIRSNRVKIKGLYVQDYNKSHEQNQSDKREIKSINPIKQSLF